MYFRDIIHNNKQNGLHAGTLATINEAQAMYYFELSEAIDTTRATDMSKEALSGSFGELLVLGRARDKLIDSGRFLEIEASQSYIRQDSSDKSNLVNPPKWKWAHDLTVKNHNSGRVVPVEVKKLRRGSTVNAGNGPNTYLPVIEVVQFRLGTDKLSYLEIIGKYCRAKAANIYDEKVSQEQAQIIEMFERRVDTEIDRVFEKLDNPKETATDYCSARADQPY